MTDWGDEGKAELFQSQIAVTFELAAIGRLRFIAGGQDSNKSNNENASGHSSRRDLGRNF